MLHIHHKKFILQASHGSPSDKTNHSAFLYTVLMMFTEVSCAQNKYATQIQRSRIRYPCRQREVIKDAAAHAVVRTVCRLWEMRCCRGV